MIKCLLLLGVLSLAFTAGSALNCYQCTVTDCGDPYTPKSNHNVTCSSQDMYCTKLEADNGDIIRTCFLPGKVPKNTELNGLQGQLAGRAYSELTGYYCNNADGCNGTGRLAEISTMMILLPASLVLISFISRP